jgi:adenine C2-methylase RlmN of 23S rRNA A2503 and tRNA A37
MATDMPGVSLALSLHAPNQELRKQIVPSARAYPLHKLLQAIEDYQTATQQRVFVEYVMLSGVNDSLEQAHELGQLLQGRAVVLNLIPWNPVYSPDFEFKAPVEGQVAEFQGVVRGQYGVHCTVRQEKGQDISGKLSVTLRAGLSGWGRVHQHLCLVHRERGSLQHSVRRQIAARMAVCMVAVAR